MKQTTLSDYGIYYITLNKEIIYIGYTTKSFKNKWNDIAANAKNETYNSHENLYKSISANFPNIEFGIFYTSKEIISLCGKCDINSMTTFTNILIDRLQPEYNSHSKVPTKFSLYTVENGIQKRKYNINDYSYDIKKLNKTNKVTNLPPIGITKEVLNMENSR